ncbi:MAG TPA: hypothetical protein VHS30_22480, partial [Streptosporangiaceae bacterium]|nr:hypothetical protein [Streptosporangiaceae bacterium]
SARISAPNIRSRAAEPVIAIDPMPRRRIYVHTIAGDRLTLCDEPDGRATPVQVWQDRHQRTGLGWRSVAM